MFKILQQILQRGGQRFFPGTPVGGATPGAFPGTGSGFMGGYSSIASGTGATSPLSIRRVQDLYGSGKLSMPSPYGNPTSRGVAGGFEAMGAMANPRFVGSPLQYFAGPGLLDMFMKINPRNPDSPTIYQNRQGGYMQMGKQQMQQNDPSVDPYGTLLDPNSPFYTPMSPGSGLF